MRTDLYELPFSGKQSRNLPVVTVNTLIIGAGAAGLKCAQALYDNGMHDLAIVVDKLGNGTSNNSGSDKQTYYKMGVFGDEPDSPLEFARSLFQGGMMHGDLAYIEALLSLPGFFELCRIGVPFPFNRYGAYVGYKTDHDPRQRATSAGPKTSMFMFRKLLEQVQHHQIPIFDRHEAVRLLTDGDRVVGAICLNKAESWRDNYGMTLFNAKNIVLATGGPGELYKISVWPHGQLGSHGLALEAGAIANNLTELQYGLASTAFRWNLSGTYQQVIPDYFSTAADGISDKRHFLGDYFADMPTMASNIFLKGYQWPFHAARLQNHGSSLIDIAVDREISAGRRVFIDFMNNVTAGADMRQFAVDELHAEAKTYLQRCGALQSTPYARLQHMNQQSIDLYAEHGIDLRQPLEVAVCAQHCNGGIRGSIWWESNIRNLFAIGEVNGSHGVRPGGSALNSGQVGAIRTAQYIANVYNDAPPPPPAFIETVRPQVAQQAGMFQNWLAGSAAAVPLKNLRSQIQQRMSDHGAFIRSLDGVNTALNEARQLYRQICDNGIACESAAQLTRAVEDRHLALTSIAFLEALRAYIEGGGGSRGGYMILDDTGELTVNSSRGRELRHRAENMSKRQEILEIQLADSATGEFAVTAVDVRPLPTDDSWFETTWAAWGRGEIYK